MLHSNYLHNGVIGKSSDEALSASQVGLLSGWGVFTTMRVVKGVLFAWERHWARLSRDAQLLNVVLPPDSDSVKRGLLNLVEANGRPDCTMRLVFVRNAGGMWEGARANSRPTDTIALTADSKEWGGNVSLGVQPNARFAANEFAGAKILSWGQNLRWAERAAAQGFDEVILLNEHGRVAECTSANIFAMVGNNVFTPPLSEGCLPGVTREILIDEIRVEGIKVIERVLTIEDLCAADEVSITSTTRELLPVGSIAGRPTGRNGAVRNRVLAAFHEYARAYVG